MLCVRSEAVLSRSAKSICMLSRGMCSTPKVFSIEHEFNALADYIEAGLENMKNPDETLEVVREDGKLIIDMGSDGQFLFEAALDSHGNVGIVSRSPLSGNSDYVYDPVEQRWISVADGHILIELFTREIMHFRSGYPAF